MIFLGLCKLPNGSVITFAVNHNVRIIKSAVVVPVDNSNIGLTVIIYVKGNCLMTLDSSVADNMYIIILRILVS